MDIERVILVCVAALIGGIAIFVGHLVSKNPLLMAEYSHMKREELGSKPFFEYRRYVKKMFYMAGYVSIVGSIISALIPSSLLSICFILVPVFMASVVVALKVPEMYGKRSHVKNMSILVGLISLASVFISIGYFLIEVECRKDNDS